LNVVGLVAVLRQPSCVVGDEREAVERALQSAVAGRRLEVELDDAEELAVLGADQLAAPVVIEGPLPDALLPQAIQVHVDHRRAGALGEALALAEQVAHLVDHRHPVPRQVGGRLPG
jgi:hypothetical protein